MVSTAEQMAQLARGRLRPKRAALTRALEGRVEAHYRLLLGMQLRRLRQMDTDIAELDQRIEAQLVPYREPYARLLQIPGVDAVVAAVMRQGHISQGQVLPPQVTPWI